MASRISSMGRCLIHRVESVFLRWTGLNFPGPPAVACAVNVPCGTETNQFERRDTKSILDSIMDSLLWAVPKKRRSLERRLMRKFGESRMVKVKPKQNIVPCLECGQWHERHTICGNCYSRVREETREMREAMGEDYDYNTPRSEVVYLYDGEQDDRPKYKGKYIVEMKKPRPEWFPKDLKTKIYTEK